MITPEEVSIRKAESLPKEVIEAFDELIMLHWSNGESRFYQDDVEKLIIKKLNWTGELLANPDFLNVEDLYRSVGWEVEYYKPGFNESFRSYFKFTKPKK